MLRIIAIVWAVFVGNILSANAVAPIAEMPYRMDYEGWLTVSATINGDGPYDFIIDSGSTITAIFENAVGDQQFPLADRNPIRILGLAGSDTLPAYELGDLTIGGVPLDNHIGIILADWAAPRKTPAGIIGLDFLTRYTVHFDTRRKLIKLYDRSDPVETPSGRWRSTKFVADSFGADAGLLYRTTVRMQSQIISCIVDLGASGTLINYTTLRKLMGGVHINGTRRGGFSTGTRLQDIFDNREIARLARVTTTSIGGARWRNRIFIVYDAQIFEELGIQYKPSCLLGADLLTERSFIFDFAREKLYIGPANNSLSN